MAAECAEALGEKLRFFQSIRYAAGTWKTQRRVIAKIEHTGLAEPTFHRHQPQGTLIGSMTSPMRPGRDGEQRIKEQQLGLFADRTSSHYWWANQFRLLLASLAYVDGRDPPAGAQGHEAPGDQVTKVDPPDCSRSAGDPANTRRVLPVNDIGINPADLRNACG